jgi:type VI protein secretion system component Hcp
MAIDVFLKLMKSDGSNVQGESRDKVCKGLIELEEFSMEALKSLTADLQDQELRFQRVFQSTGMSRVELPGFEVAELDDEPQTSGDSFSFSIKKDVDTSSGELFLNYCQTATKKEKVAFKKAVFYFRKAGAWESVLAKGGTVTPVQASFLMIQFTKPYVYKYTVESSGNEYSIPTESVDFYFENYQVTYKEQSYAGALKSSANIKGYNLRDGNDQFDG